MDVYNETKTRLLNPVLYCLLSSNCCPESITVMTGYLFKQSLNFTMWVYSRDSHFYSSFLWSCISRDAGWNAKQLSDCFLSLNSVMNSLFQAVPYHSGLICSASKLFLVQNSQSCPVLCISLKIRQRGEEFDPDATLYGIVIEECPSEPSFFFFSSWHQAATFEAYNI